MSRYLHVELDMSKVTKYNKKLAREISTYIVCIESCWTYMEYHHSKIPKQAELEIEALPTKL